MPIIDYAIFGGFTASNPDFPAFNGFGPFRDSLQPQWSRRLFALSQ
jgi:hypothetical protein